MIGRHIALNEGIEAEINHSAVTKWKNVNFGIAYGRGANALVRQAKTEGLDVKSVDMQLLIDNFYQQFPKVREYIRNCHEAVIDPGYVENAYGRRRYFYPTSDDKVLKAQQREAQNTPIQGTTADALSIALYNLYLDRQITGLTYWIVLPVHDAIFLDVPVYEVSRVIEEVLPRCMTDGVEIPNTTLKLDIDIEIMRRWSEKISIEEAVEQAVAELK